MSTNLNLQQLHSGIAPGAYLEKVQAQAHGVQFYGNDGYLLDGLTRFIGGALGAGDSSIIIATKAHRDGLSKRLMGCGIDTAVATGQGRFIALDASETLDRFMVGGWPDGERLSGRAFQHALGSSVKSRARQAAGSATNRERVGRLRS
jgi:hypothetical protein